MSYTEKLLITTGLSLKYSQFSNSNALYKIYIPEKGLTVAQGCTLTGTSTVSITVETSVIPVTSFTYAASYCIAGTNPVPTTTQDFYAGRTFTAPAGVAINPAAGEIDLANTTAGTHTITYTVIAAGCLSGGSSTATVTIAPLTAVAVSFNYQSPACLSFSKEPFPILANDFAFGDSVICKATESYGAYFYSLNGKRFVKNRLDVHKQTILIW